MANEMVIRCCNDTDSKNRSDLDRALKALGTVRRKVQDAWVLDTDLSATEVRQRLGRAVDPSVNLRVTEMDAACASWLLEQMASAWSA